MCFLTIFSRSSSLLFPGLCFPRPSMPAKCPASPRPYCFGDWTVPDGKTAGKKPFAYSSANSILVEIVSNGSIRLILPITGIIPQSHALYFVDINVG